MPKLKPPYSLQFREQMVELVRVGRKPSALSKVYEQKLKAGDRDAVAFIQRMSSVAWQHINMFGSFEFSDEEPNVDMEALASRYADSAFWNQVTQFDGVK